jgi:hypothetical protein
MGRVALAAPTMAFHMPEDPAWLQAYARVALVHAQLDHILRMFIKSLAGVTVEVALAATEREGSAILRERILTLAKSRFGEGRNLIQVQALVERCKQVTEKRNQWIHNIIARAQDETTEAMFKAGLKWAPQPTVREMDELTEVLYQLIGEINRARLHGRLAQVLLKSSALSPHH